CLYLGTGWPDRAGADAAAPGTGAPTRSGRVVAAGLRSCIAAHPARVPGHLRWVEQRSRAATECAISKQPALHPGRGGACCGVRYLIVVIPAEGVRQRSDM